MSDTQPPPSLHLDSSAIDASAAPRDAAAAPTIKNKAPLYLYGVTAVDEPIPEGILGLDDQPVLAVPVGGVAAVVSHAPPGRIRPERRLLAAHQRVVQRLSGAVTLLPVAFGTIMKDLGALRRLLLEHGAEFADQVDRVRGRAEMTLRVRLDVANVVAHVVAEEPELAALRERIAQGKAGHEEKVEAGRAFERAMNDRRDRTDAVVREAIAEIIAASAVLPRRTEGELLGLACLVDRSRLSAFEAAIDALATRLDDHHAIEVSGPWPPHSFVGVSSAVERSQAA